MTECGCKMVGEAIRFGVQIHAKIQFCPLHAAAEELLKLTASTHVKYLDAVWHGARRKCEWCLILKKAGHPVWNIARAGKEGK